jgi:hypothetical protein
MQVNARGLAALEGVAEGIVADGSMRRASAPW